MPFVLPSDSVSGAIAPVTWGDAVRDALNFLANPPHIELWHNAAQSIGSGAWAAVTFNTESVKNQAALHSIGTNPTRITITDAGVYMVSGGGEWAGNAAGRRGFGIRKNGSGAGGPTHGFVVQQTDNLTTSGVGLSIARPVKLAAGDYIELVAFQSSGAGLNLNSLPEWMPFFTATWVGLG